MRRLAAFSEPPVEGTTEVELPVEELWRIFSEVSAWPNWNRSFAWATVENGGLRLGARLVWAFNPVRPWLLYRLPSVARIVEYEPMRRVSWEVSALPGFHALHTYSFESVSDERARFGSWEVAAGPAYRLLRALWLAHFRYVCAESLAGARRLGRDWTTGIRLTELGASDSHPVLVAVPGIDGSIGSIGPIVDQLAANRKVVVVDYSAERHPTLSALVETTRALLASRFDQPVDIVGQSIGSIIAARLAADPRVSVRRVALIGPFTRVRNAAVSISAVLAGLTPRWLYRLTAPTAMALACGPVGDGADHPFFAAVGRSDPLGSGKRTAWQTGVDFGPDLLAIRQPTVVVIGAADRFVPDVAGQIAELRAVFAGGRGEVVVIPDAGHVLLPSHAIRAASAAIERHLA